MAATLFWGWSGLSPRRHAVELLEASARAHDFAPSLCGLRCHVRLFSFLPLVEDGLTCKRCADLAARK